MDRLDGSAFHDLWRCSICTHTTFSPPFSDWCPHCVLVPSWQTGLVSSRFLLERSEMTVTGVDLWPLLRDQLQHVASINGVAIEKLQGFLLRLWRGQTPGYVRFPPDAPLLFESYVGEALGSIKLLYETCGAYLGYYGCSVWAREACFGQLDWQRSCSWTNCRSIQCFQVADCNLAETLPSGSRPCRTLRRRFLGLPSLMPTFNNNCCLIEILWIL